MRLGPHKQVRLHLQLLQVQQAHARPQILLQACLSFSRMAIEDLLKFACVSQANLATVDQNVNNGASQFAAAPGTAGACLTQGLPASIGAMESGMQHRHGKSCQALCRSQTP